MNDQEINEITKKVANAVKGATDFGIMTACFIDGEFVCVTVYQIDNEMYNALKTEAEKFKLQRFKVGTKFTKRGDKHKKVYTVEDFLIITNLKGKIVKKRYVASNELMGQKIYDYDVIGTTIAMGEIK